MKRIILLIVIFILILIFLFNVKWSKLFSHGVLSEAHGELEASGDCGACHTKGKKLDNDKCLSCHDEIKAKIESDSGYHANVSRECAHCHSEHHGESYHLIHLDIETFDHNLTGWPLNGEHALLKCDACHSKESYLMEEKRCVHCHHDIHLGQLGEECGQCHSEESFKIIAYQHQDQEKGPHGKHNTIACRDCHVMEYADYPAEKGMAIRYIGMDFTCHKCHEDPHDGEYGKDCAECHNQMTFEME